MRMILLGTGGYHPNSRRETACLMLPELGVIFDAGTSFYRVPDLLETSEVDIFLTHAHLDHVVGLTFFLVPLLSGQIKSARVHGSLMTISSVKSHLFNFQMFPVNPPYEYLELQPQTILPQNGVLTQIIQEHPGSSLGFKAVWPNHSFAYLTDTFCDGSSLEFIRGVDVLIHECNFANGQEDWAKKTGHSTPEPVATMAREAGVKRLYLTHIDPQRLEDDPLDLASIRKIFPATEIAEDGLEIQF